MSAAADSFLVETRFGPYDTKTVIPGFFNIVRSENLALEYVSIRVPEMLPVYGRMMETVHSLIGRAFSNEVITPGRTTNEDVVWWLRQQVNNLGLGTWFHPSVRVQKPARTGVSLLSEDDAAVIERGDVLHVDFGITAMRLNTDTQHMGYVLRDGETSVPAVRARAKGNASRSAVSRASMSRS